MNLAARLVIDEHASSPPYEQVRRGIIELISRGDLLVGERLPTVRALATDLHVAANTVARSYRELENAGVIETRGRQGSFVKAGRNDALDAGYARAVGYVEAGRALGLSDETVLELVRRALGDSAERG